MLSKEKKLKLCEDIINSDIFKKSPKSSALLRFLVKSTLEGNYLKEDIIDIEFFGEKSNFDRNNPRVRVNVYNLRKKLNKYYETEGKSVVWKLIIDKGQYEVRYEMQNLRKTKFRNVKFKHIAPYILLIALGFVFMINQIKPSPPVLWESFFNNKKATTLIIGDSFGIKGTTITGNGGWTRDYSINSTEDFYVFIEDNTELKEIIKPADYTYITSMGAIATQNITNFFDDLNSDFEMRFSSNISMADLKNENLMYVGQHTNKSNLTSLFNDFNPYFKIIGHELFLSGHPDFEDKVYKTYFGKEDKDFSIISRFKGPENNECFLFFSNHDIGVKATIEYFTNTDSLKVFTDKYMNGKENFTAIFQAKGKERINLSLKNILVVPF